jgi:hypothetical protein
MNTRILIASAVLSLTAAGSALAQEATVFAPIPAANSNLSRAEVQAEARQALLRGELTEVAQLTTQYGFEGSMSRDAVDRATRLALSSGEVDRLNAEAYRFDGVMRRDASHFVVTMVTR